MPSSSHSHSHSSSSSSSHIDPSIEKFPHCIVWTPLPGITWFLPFIGHTGIADTQGVIHDFAGPYSIGVGSLAFGRATRYLQLNPTRCQSQDWDVGVKEASEIYKGRMHNICLDNCHSHVAKSLNIMGYDQQYNHNMVTIAVWMFFSGRFVDTASFVKTYLPFTIIVLVALLASGIMF